MKEIDVVDDHHSTYDHHFHHSTSAKVLAMDVRGGVLAVATTDRAVKAYNVENLAAGQPPPLIDSSAGTLEHQYSSIAVFRFEKKKKMCGICFQLLSPG